MILIKILSIALIVVIIFTTSFLTFRELLNEDNLIESEYCANENNLCSVFTFNETINTSFFEANNFGDYGQILYGITSSDFNNDGYIDFAVSYSSSPFNQSILSIFYNTGGNTFMRDDVCIFNYSYITDLDSGDFDGDGDIDIVFSFSYHNNRSINVCGFVTMLFNDGCCFFNNGKNIIKIGNSSDQNNTRHNPRITSADYDSDGDVDIIVGDMSGKVELFLNDGRSSFYHSDNIYDFGFSSCGLSSVDFDSDGDIDVIIVASIDEINRNRGYMYLKENIDGINLSDLNSTIIITNMSNIVNSASIASLDHENDGDIDFIVGIMNKIYLYQNNGLTFKRFLICILPSSEEGFGDNMTYGGLATSDFDDNGYDDFVSGGSVGVIRMFKNNGEKI